MWEFCPTILHGGVVPGQDLADDLTSLPPVEEAVLLGQQVATRDEILGIQADQINMTVLFWYLVKRDLVQCTSLYKCTLDRSIFRRYKKKTAKFIWSSCILELARFQTENLTSVSKCKVQKFFTSSCLIKN